MFGLFISFNLATVSWLPSFCVLMGILSKEAAARVMSCLFVVNFVLRIGSVFASIGTLAYLKFTCYFTAICFGPLAFLLYLLGFRLFLVVCLTFCYPVVAFMFVPSGEPTPSGAQQRRPK